MPELNKEYLEKDKLYTFQLTLRIKDVFIKLDDVVDFIKHRLNLKYSCCIEHLYIIEDPDNPCKLVKGAKNEISNET